MTTFIVLRIKLKSSPDHLFKVHVNLNYLLGILLKIEAKIANLMKSRSAQLGLVSQVESAVGLLNLHSICEYGKSQDRKFKFEALVFGSDDFLASIGMFNSE